MRKRIFWCALAIRRVKPKMSKQELVSNRGDNIEACRGADVRREEAFSKRFVICAVIDANHVRDPNPSFLDSFC